MKKINKKLAVFFGLVFLSQMSFAQKKQNVLFIIIDDFGYHDLSINGSKLYETPNMDALAKNSVNFTNAHVSYPRCVPSRYAMMSATYPVEEDHGHLGSIPTGQNVIKQFGAAGYSSFYVGKWHLGSGEDSPKGFGFNQSYAAGDAGGTDSHFYPFNTKRKAGDKGEKAPIEDVEAYGKQGDFLSDVLTKRTIEYIKENKNKPFFGVMAYYAVHTPIEAKEEDIARNKKQLDQMGMNTEPVYVKEGNGVSRTSQNDPTYAGLVENTDENVGKIIKALKDEGVYDNTVIVLVSDHGGLSTKGPNNRIIPTSNAPFRAGKGWMYEGGTRVPLMIKVPGVMPFEDKENLVMSFDILPTLADVVLGKTISGVDGKSFKNVINKKENWNNRTIYWNSYKARPTQTGDSKTSAIRIGDYKLLQFVETGKIELYNEREDISENNDLSLKMPEKAAEMLKMLEDWKKAKNIKMKANHKSGGETMSPAQEAKKETRKAERKAERKEGKLK